MEPSPAIHATRRRLIRAALITVTLLLTLATIAQAIHYHDRRATLERATYDAARQQAQSLVAQLDEDFRATADIANRIADALTAGRLRYDLGVIRLRAELRRAPLVDGLAVTFAPFVFDPDLRLYQYYVYRQPDGSIATLDGATYDYTLPPSIDLAQPDTRWYFNVVNRGAQWTDPFTAAGTGRTLIEYGTPFFLTDADGQQRVAGIVTIDYSLAGVQALMAGLELGDIGYGYLISQTGKFLSHPDETLVARRTIYDLARPYRQVELTAAVQQTMRGESTFLESVDPVSGEELWTFFEPMPSTGWVVGIVIYRDNFAIPPQQTAQAQAALLLTGTLALVGALWTLARVETGHPQRLWMASTSMTALAVVNVVLIWVIAANFPRTSTLITSQSSANRVIDAFSRSLPPDQPIYRLPTGIHVQSVGFEGTHTKLNGLIYQFVPEGVPEGFEEGFYFPATNVEEFTIDLLEEREADGGTHYVWYFATVLAQRFDPALFPFDTRDIRIRLLPAEQEHTVVFTPYLTTYDTVAPTQQPGVDDAVHVNNWAVRSSSFRYQTIVPGTTFGFERPYATPTLALEFTIQMSRVIVGPFIAYVLPGLVATGLLFAFLLYDRTPGDKQELITALNYTAAIFFVIAIIHTNLRDNIGAISITYLEHLYLLLYVSVVAVSADTFVFVRAVTPGHDYSLIPKLVYLPIVSGVLLIVTLAMFIYG
jgi:hypothetical protein